MFSSGRDGKDLRTESTSRDKEGIVVGFNENESPVKGLGHAL